VKEIYDDISPEYTSFSDSDLSPERIWQQTKHKELAFGQCLRMVSSAARHNKLGIRKPRLLDVGCGLGGFIKFASPYYDCYGFDASFTQIRYASRYSRYVRCASSLNDYKGQLGGSLPNFDLISLWDVLEHIRQPKSFLKELSYALDPEGILFISVPNAEPMVIKNYLRSIGLWPFSHFSWNPQEHVTYFSPETLSSLCSMANFRILQIGAVSIYPRPLSIFEIVRRFWFGVTSKLTSLAPQIYVMARRAR
jgi:2-polyprenyl-3-methyl-5-hydroxy-6-metoxy-1,4-benzoquinol methylase